DDVGRDPKMFNRPQLAGAEEPHLDFIDDQQDPVTIEYFLQLAEEIARRNDVTAGALHGLDIERSVLGLAGLGIPDAVVFAFKQTLELLNAVEAVLLLAHPLGAAEVIR